MTTITIKIDSRAQPSVSARERRHRVCGCGHCHCHRRRLLRKTDCLMCAAVTMHHTCPKLRSIQWARAARCRSDRLIGAGQMTDEGQCRAVSRDKISLGPWPGQSKTSFVRVTRVGQLWANLCLFTTCVCFI